MDKYKVRMMKYERAREREVRSERSQDKVMGRDNSTLSRRLLRAGGLH